MNPRRNPGEPPLTFFHLIALILLLAIEITCIVWGAKTGGILYALLGAVLGIPIGVVFVSVCWFLPLLIIKAVFFPETYNPDRSEGPTNA